jgi:hypothetical protein
MARIQEGIGDESLPPRSTGQNDSGNSAAREPDHNHERVRQERERGFGEGNASPATVRSTCAGRQQY